MSPPPTDEEVRQRYAAVFGASAADLAGVPVEALRNLLADVDEQLDTYVDLGFLTPAEADAMGEGRA